MKKWRKNIPNILTSVRVILTCFLNFHIVYYCGKIAIPFIVFSVIFFTDFLDGKIARFYGLTSYFGAIFDVAADLLYIIVTYIVMCYLHIIPLWFFIIIIIKFIEFSITSYVINKNATRKSPFIFDYIGRVVAVLFYLIPLLTYVSHYLSKSIYFFTVDVLLYIITLLAFISFVYRVSNCVKVSNSVHLTP